MTNDEIRDLELLESFGLSRWRLSETLDTRQTFDLPVWQCFLTRRHAGNVM